MNANDAQLVQSVKGYLKLHLDSLNASQWVRRLEKGICDLGFCCPSDFSGL